MKTEYYEHERTVREYLLMHYGKEEVLDPFEIASSAARNYPLCCAQLCFRMANRFGVSLKRVLDIGCSVGRSSFELAREVNSVTAVDYSKAFIGICNQLKSDGDLDYDVVEEGEVVTPQTAVVDHLINRDRVTFQWGDACNLSLSKDFGGKKFNLILMANLLCRLHSPKDCLEKLADLVEPGGLVVMLTPNSWQGTFTEKTNWVGGYYKTTSDGLEVKRQAVRTIDGLKDVMGTNFTLVDTSNQPYLIRENEREYQVGVSLVTVWQRN